MPKTWYLQVEILQTVQRLCAVQQKPGGTTAEDNRMQARQLQRHG